MLQDIYNKSRQVDISDERIRELLKEYPPAPAETDMEGPEKEYDEDQADAEQEEKVSSPADPEKSCPHKAVDRVLVEGLRSELARWGGKQKIYSDTLGEEIWIVSTEDQIEQVKPAVAYTVEEYLLLVRHRPAAEVLRNIHIIKKIFDGELVEVTQEDVNSPTSPRPLDR